MQGKYTGSKENLPLLREAARKERTQKLFLVGARFLSGILLLFCIIVSVYCWKSGIFRSVEALQAFAGRAGKGGIVLFTVLQAVQVVVPILPGGIGCLGGVLLFGNRTGFLCNYIGICIGSAIAFGIAKYCGKPVLSVIFPEKVIHKYESWTEEENRFAKWFALAIFLPVAPDDFLCYLAGTTRMSWRVFMGIIFLAKPWAIAAYSLGLVKVLGYFLQLIG